MFGLLDVGRRAWLEIRREQRQRLIVVELRGLHGSPDTPAKEAELGEFLGERQWLPLDFRPKSASELVDPRLMLQCLGTLLPTIQTLATGRDKSDVFLAVGGLAAVPAIPAEVRAAADALRLAGRVDVMREALDAATAAQVQRLARTIRRERYPDAP